MFPPCLFTIFTQGALQILWVWWFGNKLLGDAGLWSREVLSQKQLEGLLTLAYGHPHSPLGGREMDRTQVMVSGMWGN